MECSVQSLDITSAQIRKKILEMAYIGNSGHISCAFSIVEILNCIYSRFLKINLMNLKDQNRDYFVLSKGHGVMSLYVLLTELGIIKKSYLETYFSEGSPLHGLAEYGVPGIEASGGSLGHGISIATGMALGLKEKNDQRVFCLVGDGEMNEGTFWESLLFISHHQLRNLTIIVDSNKFQAMGETKNILDLGDLRQKFESFNLFVSECDGHNMQEIEKAISKGVDSMKPSVVIANTTKGKGVKSFENQNEWHYHKMTEEIYEQALKEVSL